MKLIIRKAHIISLLLLSFHLPSFSAANQGSISYGGEEILNLDGEWEFYWKSFLKPGEPIHTEPSMQIVTSLWNDYEIENTEVSAYGYATYRLTILSDTSYHQLGMKIPNFYTSYRLYLNGELIANNGQPGVDKASTTPQYLPIIMLIDLEKGKNELIIHIANFHHSRGGFYESMFLGDFESMVSERRKQDYIGIFSIGCMLMIFLFFVSLGFYWRKDKAVFFFSLFSLSFSIRVATYDLEFFSRFVPYISWSLNSRIEYLSLYLSWIMLVLFFTEIIPKMFNLIFLKLFVAVTFVVLMLTLFLPISFYSQLLVSYATLGISYLVYAAENEGK